MFLVINLHCDGVGAGSLRAMAWRGAIAALAIGLSVPAASAQGESAEERVVVDPLLLSSRKEVTAPPRVILEAAEGSRAREAEVVFDLDVTYTKGRIWNPKQTPPRYDEVYLRSYQDHHRKEVSPKSPYVSPTIEVLPGNTIRFTLHNKLPNDPSCTATAAGGNPNIPHCFNGTNLHTHGLWVNPAGNGDNMLLSINPGVSFQYEYKLPPDHPAGTFWYHTHRHGSTALQVSSGMAGALVVRGDRPPTEKGTGDIDTLLKPTKRQAFRERLLVLQQIQYACREKPEKEGKLGDIKINPDGSYRCDPNDVGTIEGYDQFFDPQSWRKSGRHTSINGLVLPTFDGAKAGQIERWRVIHGGVRDTINLEFRKCRDGKCPDTGRVPAAEFYAYVPDAYVDKHCTGDVLLQHLIAADGLTMAAAFPTEVAVLQPGYRWDSLVVYPEAGEYCVIDGAAPPSGSVDQEAAPSRQLLGFIKVEKVESETKVNVGNVSTYLKEELVKAAEANMPAGKVKDVVVKDLESGLKLSKFVPFATIAAEQVTPPTQELVFNIDRNKKPLEFQVNGKPYKPDHIDRTLQLGKVDEWVLKSDFASHPFHIHINPFQIVEISDPKGKDVSVSDPKVKDDYDPKTDKSGITDPQYRGLKNVWKDTLWVKNSMPPGPPETPPGEYKKGQYKLIVRTRYERYIGDFVLHCHILDHEDQGMMQNVRVALPDGAGGTGHGPAR
jgi:L-ascorbate oxidase